MEVDNEPEEAASIEKVYLDARDALAAHNKSPTDFYIWYHEQCTYDHLIAGRGKLFKSHFHHLERLLEAVVSNATLKSAKLRTWLADLGRRIILHDAAAAPRRFMSAQQVTPAFLSDAAVEETQRNIENDMPFLYALLAPLVIAADSLDAEEERDEPGEDGMPGVARTAGAARAGHADDRERDKTAVRRLQARHMLTLLGSALLFFQNRRYNHYPLRMSIFAMITGASRRFSNFLADASISSNRDAALQAATTLANANALEIKRDARERQDRGLGFDGTLDNVDVVMGVQSRQVFHQAIDKHGAMIYGLRSPFATPAAFSIDALRAKLQQPEPLALHHFLPTREAIVHFTRSSAPAHAFRALDRALELAGASVRVPSAWLAVEDVELTDQGPAKVDTFRLIDSPDAASSDVPKLVDALRLQLGLTETQFASLVRVLSLDGGSKMLWEGSRGLRSPASSAYDALEAIITILAGGHTFWAAAGAIYRLHARYMRSQTSEANHCALLELAKLAEMKVPPLESKTRDYNALVRLLLDVGDALLADAVLRLLGRARPSDVTAEDLALGRGEALKRDLVERYFSAAALASAKSTDEVHYASLLRLRDLTRFLEAYDATRCGDVGRLFHVYEHWALLFNGVPRCPHYRRLLPNLLIQIRLDLPAELAAYVRRTYLINPSGRPGHSVARDYYLETLIYFLKFFWSLEGHQNWPHLIDRISSNIVLFRDLLHQMPRLMGRPIVVKNNEERSLEPPAFSALLLQLAEKRCHDSDPARQARLARQAREARAPESDDAAPAGEDGRSGGEDSADDDAEQPPAPAARSRKRAKAAKPILSELVDAEATGLRRLSRLATDGKLAQFRFTSSLSTEDDDEEDALDRGDDSGAMVGDATADADAVFE